jgi:hypothetical protein
MKPFLIVLLTMSSIAAHAQAPKPLGTISGIVQDSARTPLRGVTVTAIGPGGMASVQTDATGAFTLSTPVGPYRVTATHPQSRPATFNHVEIGSAPVVRVNFTMEPWADAPSPPTLAPDRDVMISADGQTVQGDFVLYRGNVRMTTSGMVLYADELDFNIVTRSASARGRVTMRVLPLPSRTP